MLIKATIYDSENKKSVVEDEETLEDEKKKNLSILQSVLGSIQQTPSSKTAGKAKTFRSDTHTHACTKSQTTVTSELDLILNGKIIKTI